MFGYKLVPIHHLSWLERMVDKYCVRNEWYERYIQLYEHHKKMMKMLDFAIKKYPELERQFEKKDINCFL